MKVRKTLEGVNYGPTVKDYVEDEEPAWGDDRRRRRF